MKNNLMKTIGITAGVCATLWFTPASVEATEDGNALQLDANLLNEKEGKATILDIQLDNIPLVGDLQVKIPSKSTEETTEQSAALATVDVAGGDLVEDLNVSVLEENKSDHATAEQNKSSVASVEVKTPLTEEVSVEVLSSDQKNSMDTKSFDGGVVEVNAPKLPIVGETHVGVLDKHTAENGENSSESAGLVQADLDGDLLKNTSVNVLATENSASADADDQSASLVSAKVDEESLGGLVEDLNVSVLEGTQFETATTKREKGSLVSVGLTTPLTDEVNVDVLLADRQNGSVSSSFDGGLVEVNASNLPIVGETHVGVLDKHTTKNGENSSVSAGLVQADLDGDLLKDTSVNVLATENSASEDASDQSASLVSAKVDEESLGGLVEDLNVSVLEGTQFESATTKREKGSLVSVGLTTPLTDEVNVDVLLADRQNDSISSSFDGGLVEVNAPNLPIVGETHVGVLDRHTAKNGENSSYSAGLVQVGVDGDLLKDTSVTVLAENKFSNADGTTIKNDGVSIQLGTDTIGPINVDILSKEQFYPNTNIVEPAPDAGGDDTTTPTPPSVIVPNPGDKDDTPGNDNNPGTDNPGTGNDNDTGTVNPDPGNGDDQGSVNPGPGNGDDQGSVNPGPGNGDDQGSVNPGPGNGDDQGAVNPDVDNGVNAPITDANDSIDGVGSTDPNANTDNSFVDEIVSDTVGSHNLTALSGALALVNHSTDKKHGNGTGTNMGASLPKTGGLLDGALLLLLSLLLLVSGVGLRRAVS